MFHNPTNIKPVPSKPVSYAQPPTPCIFIFDLCFNDNIFLISGQPTKGWRQPIKGRPSRGHRRGHQMRQTKNEEFIDTNYDTYTNKMNLRYYELHGK